MSTDLTITTLELRVETWGCSLRMSRRREMQRLEATPAPFGNRLLREEAYANRLTRTGSLWMGRQLRRTGRRFIVVGLPVVLVIRDQAEDFLQNVSRLRCRCDVIQPPPGVLEGVRFVDAKGSRVVKVPREG